MLKRTASALAAILFSFALALPASAVTYSPAPDPLPGPGPHSSDWSATPGFVVSIYSSPANEDLGNQSVATILATLQGPGWLNSPMTFVAGGKCETNGVNCNETTKSGTTTNAGTIFGIHFGNNFLVLAYKSVVENFSISGLPYGVSNIFTFTTATAVPLPAGLPLLGAGVGILALLGWRRKRSSAPITN